MEKLRKILQMLRSQGGEGDPGLTSAQRTVALFLEDLEHNPDSLARPWALREMAEHCGMKVTAFTKYCRKTTNTSPAKYLARCRLARAAHLLKEAHDQTITQIAFDCGFSSSQYFAVEFRKLYKCTPREYRAAGMAGSR